MVIIEIHQAENKMSRKKKTNTQLPRQMGGFYIVCQNY